MSEFPVALVSDWNGLAGQTIATQLARSGYSLLINGPEEDIFALQSQDIEGKILAIPFESANEESVQQVILAGLEYFGRLDVVVNNFYNLNDAALHEITETLWGEMLQNNLKSAFHVCRAAALVMMEQQFGKIINLTTTSCFTGVHLPFAATAAALHSMTRSLAKELAPHVRANTIACGMLDEPWIDEGGPELREMLQKSIPLGRLCKDTDIADAVLYLASGADFMSGQMLVLDGGETMR
ncbi:SDR family oxidoreductase [bacterium]|nr:SDR family oxidoreductase [bacterium]